MIPGTPVPGHKNQVQLFAKKKKSIYLVLIGIEIKMMFINT